MKPKVIPGSPPSAEAQKNFVRKYEALRADPNAAVIFGDAVHFMHQNIPGLCRCDPLPPLVPETDSGRKRLNCLGAYDPETCSLTLQESKTVMPNESLNLLTKSSGLTQARRQFI